MQKIAKKQFKRYQNKKKDQICGVKMFKKIKLFKKLMAIVDVVDDFWSDNKDKIEKAKEALPEIKGYISDFERMIGRLKK